MGNGGSVSPRSFQEQYYLFFDETREPAASKAGSSYPLASGRRYAGEYVDKGFISQGSSESKLVHRGNSDDIFNLSTHNDQPYGATSLTSAYSESLYDDRELTTDRIFHDDESTSEGECTFREYQSPTGRVIAGHWNGDEFVSGRITWSDGREYNGALKGSVPNGFGAYRTAGGKEYTGYWRCGLQHGTGSYVTEKDGCRFQRRGVWENGQLVRWLDEEEGGQGEGALDTKAKKTLLEEIMATPNTTPALSPSSIAASSLPSVGMSPCAHMGGM